MTTGTVAVLEKREQLRLVPSLERDDTLEQIADDLDKVVEYGGVPRDKILQFIRIKLQNHRQPFPSDPPVDWSGEMSWAFDELCKRIIRGIDRFPMTSEHQKYAMLVELRRKVRARIPKKK